MNSKFVMVHVRANLRPLYNTKCPPYGIAKCIFKDNRVSFAYTLPIKPKSFMLHVRAILRPLFPFRPPHGGWQKWSRICSSSKHS